MSRKFNRAYDIPQGNPDAGSDGKAAAALAILSSTHHAQGQTTTRGHCAQVWETQFSQSAREGAMAGFFFTSCLKLKHLVQSTSSLHRLQPSIP